MHISLCIPLLEQKVTPQNVSFWNMLKNVSGTSPHSLEKDAQVPSTV